MSVVPAVTRLTVSQATARIEAAGLHVGEIVTSPKVTVTVVAVGTDPVAGTSLAEGTAITLFISTQYHP